MEVREVIESLCLKFKEKFVQDDQGQDVIEYVFLERFVVVLWGMF